MEAMCEAEISVAKAVKSKQDEDVTEGIMTALSKLRKQ
jgi:hypothetical protein